MEYRKLENCDDLNRLSVIGIGAGGMQETADEEIEHIVRRSIVNGINVFDLCAGGKNIFRPVGRAIRGVRKKITLMMHFGAAFDEFGEYEWTRDPEQISRTFRWQLRELQTDYADIGILHCVDDEEDFVSIRDDGLLDYMKELKEKRKLRHLGFSTHTTEVADKLLDLGIFDVMMLAINPADDGNNMAERAKLMCRCKAMGVGVVAMRVFRGGRLLGSETSPFERALTQSQCLQYAIDCKAVVSAVAGVKSLAELDKLLEYEMATEEERDYSFVKQLDIVKDDCAYKQMRASNVVDIFSHRTNIAK